MKKIILIICVLNFINLLGQESKESFKDNFKNLSNWKKDKYSKRGNYFIEENKGLTFTTRAELPHNPKNNEILKRKNTDRVKIHLKDTSFTTGIYSWKVFVPKMKLYEACSIGAFLYNDDNHELDFEIGSGTEEKRKELMAQTQDLIVYCSSQNNPKDFSSQVLIKENKTHTFQFKIYLNNNQKYIVEWIINSKKIKTLTLNYGIEKKFKVYCSLENLFFMGDNPTSIQNRVTFNEFSYQKL